MSKSNTTENDTLNALLRGVDPAWRSNANRYIAYHTADPGEAGSAITNELSVGGYIRIAVVASSGFTEASGGSSSNVDALPTVECTSGSETATHLSIVTTASGAGQILYSGALTTPRLVDAGTILNIAAGSLVISED